MVRLSDFQSNEYMSLIVWDKYEPGGENPMIGFRGSDRYTDAFFKVRRHETRGHPESSWNHGAEEQ